MKISDSAIKEFRKALKEADKNKTIRISISAGCCGPSFTFNMVDKKEKEDVKVGNDDFYIFVQKEAYELLKNFEIKFSDGQFYLENE